VRSSDAKAPFVIKVVDSEEINAMALPGGFFYVNTGLILAASEEAELAGVMAHEISHVVQRHGTRAASKQMMAQLPVALLGGLLGKGVEHHAAQTPVRRVGRPEDIAAACSFLVRDEAGYVTGQVIGVNGGRNT